MAKDSYVFSYGINVCYSFHCRKSKNNFPICQVYFTYSSFFVHHCPPCPLRPPVDKVDERVQANVIDSSRWCPVPASVQCLCRYQSGQALFSPLKLRSEGLVPASAAPCADADFHSHLPRRRDSLPSCPQGSQEAKETLQGPRTPTHEAPAQ